MTGRHGLDSLA